MERSARWNGIAAAAIIASGLLFDGMLVLGMLLGMGDDMPVGVFTVLRWVLLTGTIALLGFGLVLAALRGLPNAREARAYTVALRALALLALGSAAFVH